MVFIKNFRFLKKIPAYRIKKTAVPALYTGSVQLSDVAAVS